MRVEPPNEQHLAELGGGDSRIAQGLVHRTCRALDEIARHRFERAARKRGFQVKRTCASLGEKREVHARRIDRGKLLFRGGRSLAYALERGGVATHVDAVLAHEPLGEVIDDALVEIVAAEMVVARRGEHLDDPVAYLDHRYVERTASQIVDHDLLRACVVEAVGEGGRGRLVDDAQHVEPRDAPGVLRRLALHVVEIGGHGDHRIDDAVSHVGLGILAQLPQDHRRQLLGGVALVVDRRPPIGAHVALHRGEGAVGVGGRLPHGDRAHEALAVLAERDDARGGSFAFGVGDDAGASALDEGDAAVGGAEVYSYGGCHARSFRGV